MTSKSNTIVKYNSVRVFLPVYLLPYYRALWPFVEHATIWIHVRECSMEFCFSWVSNIIGGEVSSGKC